MALPIVNHNSDSPTDGIRRMFDIDGETDFPVPTRQIFCSDTITDITFVTSGGSEQTINKLPAGTYPWEWIDCSACTIPDGADFKGCY